MITAIMLSGYQVTASSATGKSLAVQAAKIAKIAAKAAPSTINVSIPATQAVIAQQQVRAYSQNLPKVQVPTATTALIQQAGAGKRGSDKLDMAKWLAFGGLVIAADIARDEMNKIDFENIDSEQEPNFKERVAYLQYLLNDVKLAADFDMELLAAMYTGNLYGDIFDDVKQIKNNNKEFITMQDFQEHLDDLNLGKINEDWLSKQTDFNRMETARHEAGHAVIEALYLNKKSLLTRATIIARGDEAIARSYSVPLLMSHSGEMAKIMGMINYLNLLEEEMIGLLAGGVAEQLLELADGDELTLTDIHDYLKKPGCRNDIAELNALLIKYGEYQILLEESQARMNGEKSFIDTTIDDYDARCEKMHIKILSKAYLKTIELLILHQKEHQQIAQILYDNGIISGEQVYKIVGVNPQLLGFQDDRQLAPIEQYLEYR